MRPELIDRATTGVAAAGVSSPLWAHYFYVGSDIAAAALPYLSAAWLVMQMAVFVIRQARVICRGWGK